jgi:hypothetical protein
LKEGQKTDDLSFVRNRIADPLFAIAIGASAATLRIQREQREQAVLEGRDPKAIGLVTVLEVGDRRVRRWWNGDF